MADMEMKKIHMGTMAYGQDSKDELVSHLEMVLQQGKHKSRPSLTGLDDQRIKVGPRGRRDISSRIFDIAQALSLCHNVTPIIENGEVSYQASSPDEVAIVKWTESIGMTLYYRDRESIHVKNVLGDIMEYEVLHIFPFTSETKRMGIVIRDKVTREAVFYEKGADSVMTKIVQHNDWLEEECSNMARDGLRTLVIARKRLSEDVLSEFEQKYSEAKLSINDRNTEMRNVVESFLESDLELLGLTGVEDKLQDEVKITLELLRNAGIKIWMLTGDKIETATCIAVSSKLVSRNQAIYQVQKLANINDAEDALSNLRSRSDHCLVIDGQSLQIMLEHFPKEFILLSSTLSAVVCCRCSPTQKADIASLVKKYTKKRVCCIGDGGNDVSMIQAANVGVGIVGKEGMQASLAADFSITQFSHISRLFIWHGRNSYKRTAKLSQFVIHRGVIIAVMQAVFSAIFYFAPIPIYQGMLVVGYATFFTNFPVFSLVLDRDVSEEVAMLYPELYKEIVKGRSLNYKTFFTWILISIYQGGVIMILCILLFNDEFIRVVTITFTALILNELLMVAAEINTWHYLMILAEFLSIVSYTAAFWILKNELEVPVNTMIQFLLKVGLITLISFLPLYVFKVVKHFLSPPSYSKLRG